MSTAAEAFFWFIGTGFAACILVEIACFIIDKFK